MDATNPENPGAERRIFRHRSAQTIPIDPLAARNRVVNRGRGVVLVIQMPVYHCVRILQGHGLIKRNPYHRPRLLQNGRERTQRTQNMAFSLCSLRSFVAIPIVLQEARMIIDFGQKRHMPSRCCHSPAPSGRPGCGRRCRPWRHGHPH